MEHHAYVVVDETEEGISSALSYVEETLGLAAQANPDVMTLRHGLLSVDDARRLRALAELAPVAGERKAIIISASRLFHEAQNALLKLFEEPPAGTVLILVIPSEGMLLPTLRSRLMTLPVHRKNVPIEPFASEAGWPVLRSQEEHPAATRLSFLSVTKAEREKIVTKILDRTKSDKDEEKQAGRLEAIQLLEGLEREAHAKWLVEKNAAKREALRGVLDDLTHFLPILHERSAPLKLIFEHLQLVTP